MDTLLMGALDETFAKHILDLVEEKKEGDIAARIDEEVQSMQLPGWYKEEFLNNVYNRLNAAYSRTGSRKKYQKLKNVIEAMELKYDGILLKR